MEANQLNLPHTEDCFVPWPFSSEGAMEKPVSEWIVAAAHG